MQMKKTVSLIIVLLLALVVLSGCVKVDYSTTINKDGSGEISFIYSMNKTVIQNSEKNTVSATYDIREKAELAGYTVEEYEDEETAGLKATKEVEDITEKSYIQEIFGEYIKNDEESKIKITKNITGKTYSQNVELDTTSILKELGGKIKYTINLPTKVKKTNANNISNNGKTLTWDLDIGTAETIYFTAKSGQVWFVLFVIIILAIIGFTVYNTINNKSKNNGKEQENKEKQSKNK